jgi:hypothetical protein
MLNWFKAAGIRALRSMAGTILTLMGTNMVDVTTLDWKSILFVAAGTGVASILLAIKGLPEIPAEAGLVDDTPGRHEA